MHNIFRVSLLHVTTITDYLNHFLYTVNPQEKSTTKISASQGSTKFVCRKCICTANCFCLVEKTDQKEILLNILQTFITLHVIILMVCDFCFYNTVGVMSMFDTITDGFLINYKWWGGRGSKLISRCVRVLKLRCIFCNMSNIS